MLAAVDQRDGRPGAAVVGLTVWLGAARTRSALTAVVASWRQSLGAGLLRRDRLGSAGSPRSRFAPAGPVRAVGVVEMPMAAIAGRRLFAERLHALAAGPRASPTALGVVLAALG